MQLTDFLTIYFAGTFFSCQFFPVITWMALGTISKWNGVCPVDSPSISRYVWALAVETTVIFLAGVHLDKRQVGEGTGVKLFNVPDHGQFRNILEDGDIEQAIVRDGQGQLHHAPSVEFADPHIHAENPPVINTFPVDGDFKVGMVITEQAFQQVYQVG